MRFDIKPGSRPIIHAIFPGDFNCLLARPAMCAPGISFDQEKRGQNYYYSSKTAF